MQWVFVMKLSIYNLMLWVISFLHLDDYVYSKQNIVGLSNSGLTKAVGTILGMGGGGKIARLLHINIGLSVVSKIQ